MRFAVPLLLIVAAAPLAGCGAAHDPSLNEQQAAAAQNRAPDRDKVMADRWGQIFSNPAAVVAAANDFGFKVEGYKAAGKGFAATGKVTWPEEPNGIAVESAFEATGAKADTIETIRFTFDVKHEEKLDGRARDSYGYVRRIVLGFLARFEVGPGDTINGALQRRESAKDVQHGVSIIVDANPIGGGNAKDRHITVTFTRVGASAPANQTQGK
ncbi:hypothetical protein J2W22_000046 [Sphingomonas kyeonggiensis]|uniref:hypothetical protein n=1 Tax=Sphingomonas kyeonggiensis TaxID=1268553 RepID=UPI0027872A76|nr:hypothetical protein [Sphingomonas kyeonggiensis]MDQ0247999.1 hypothetical protein [Sphingomonas kyeonggiensis]